MAQHSRLARHDRRYLCKVWRCTEQNGQEEARCEYYNECDEDGVVTPHTFMMKVAESYSFSLGFFASMMFFRDAPIVGFCGGANICTCVFDFEAVKVLCGV